jgi:hypothetical protein
MFGLLRSSLWFGWKAECTHTCVCVCVCVCVWERERERERERDFIICQPVCDWSFYVFFLSSASFLHAVIWRWRTLEQIWSYLCELISESGWSKLQAVVACWKPHLEGWFERVCWRACCSAACRIPRGRHWVVMVTVWSFAPCQLHAEWMR